MATKRKNKNTLPWAPLYARGYNYEFRGYPEEGKYVITDVTTKKVVKEAKNLQEKTVRNRFSEFINHGYPFYHW